jgi:hypothetical protein
MPHRTIACAATVAGTFVAQPVRAQETITLDVRFADPILSPGEVQTIEVWATLAPGPGGTAIWNTNGGSGQQGVVLAFGYAQFDVRSVQNGSTGSFSNLALGAGLIVEPGFEGTPDTFGNVLGIRASQLILGPYVAANPMHLWTGTWTPSDYATRTVELTTLPFAPLGVYLQVGGAIPVTDDWASINPSASFQIVPAPAGVSVFSMAALGLPCRRRRSR